MIGSTPRILTYMQLLAVPFGALALAFMYPLLRDTYGIIGEHAQLFSPTSQRWVGFAKIVTHDFSGADTHGRRRDAVCVDAGLVRRGRARRHRSDGARAAKGLARFMPSPTGMGIAMLIPFSAVTMIFVGAVLDRIWKRVHPRQHEALFDSHRVRVDRRRGARGGRHSAARHAGPDVAARQRPRCRGRSSDRPLRFMECGRGSSDPPHQNPAGSTTA